MNTTITEAARNVQLARQDLFAARAGAEDITIDAASDAHTKAQTALLDLLDWDLDAALAAERAYIESLSKR